METKLVYWINREINFLHRNHSKLVHFRLISCIGLLYNLEENLKKYFTGKGPVMKTFLLPSHPYLNTMGKGDIKSKKGKMANGSFGKKRLRNETMPKKLITKVEAEVLVKAKTKKAEK